MAAGYIYVLVNSSIPSIVKVGRTKRSPSERASELSGATGVATPFLVVYEDYFDDCEAVETYIFTTLARNGVRVSDNREFFRATVSDVVKVISSMPPSIGEKSSPSKNEDLESSTKREGPPWESLMEEAERFYNGRDGYLQDYSEALKLYTDAARLGCSWAYQQIGHMYQNGKGVIKNHDRALYYYKEGTKKGEFLCWGTMAMIFAEVHHLPNAQTSFCNYVREGEARNWGGLGLHEHNVSFMLSFLWSLFWFNQEITTIDPELLEALSRYRVQLLHLVDINVKTKQNYAKHNSRLITALRAIPPLQISVASVPGVYHAE